MQARFVVLLHALPAQQISPIPPHGMQLPSTHSLPAPHAQPPPLLPPLEPPLEPLLEPPELPPDELVEGGTLPSGSATDPDAPAGGASVMT